MFVRRGSVKIVNYWASLVLPLGVMVLWLAAAIGLVVVLPGAALIGILGFVLASPDDRTAQP